MAVVYLNGRYVQAERAKVSAFDRGFSYGDGLFETIRAYTGWIFGLERHLGRLKKGADQIGIPFEGDVDTWRKVMGELLRRNRLQDADASLRLTVTRGPDVMGSLLPPDAPPSPTLLLVAKPLDAGIAERQQVGIGAVTIRWGSPFNPLRIKSLDYLYNMLAMAHAKHEGAVEALFVGTDGCVIEGTTSNLFSISQGMLATPPESSGLLPGITREVVIELAKREGLIVHETPVPFDVLFSADEAFLTGSLKEITPLIAIDGSTIGTGSPGPVTRRLQQCYRTAVQGEPAQGRRSVKDKA
ncbi:MAG: branched-chain amino acid aminotransferase [Candidatus Methylomirabilis oxygeniifera]|uniref:Branched chain amino acid: 2-keto-4-methylthiobutyrate aminotransferase / branched chain amino acid aminotransferase n=1 Tax=Methylomirabilis oxygeniifera TaxID=671143 RepID=D5MHG3_METO1|nr:MAG: branched-chain amino acid aminotransferase [Candidatus Methylomirabilis oxyfera]CBE69195.1 Branched chain amino acid: 2-keto-4-methylthiobutyrate aminotransferase / branched chain amino acid aminotransferase [Candidatus Methylomirabilis oxyfera]